MSRYLDPQGSGCPSAADSPNMQVLECVGLPTPQNMQKQNQQKQHTWEGGSDMVLGLKGFSFVGLRAFLEFWLRVEGLGSRGLHT